MMAFIEHHAGWDIAVIESTKGGLCHDQRMVGDDDIGTAGLSHCSFDKALTVMAAGGVDAFAAPVGQPQRVAEANQIGEPGRKIATRNIAGPGLCRPARQQTKPNGAGRTGRATANCFFHI